MKAHALVITIFLVIYSSVASAERLAVTVSVANIRSGPGAKNDILWKVEKYHPINILERSDSWLHFRDFEGDEGWIHKSLTGKISSVITDRENCNIRSGPGAGNQILFTVEKGIPFKVIKRKGKWIHIQHADGDKGWIHKSLVW